MNKNKPFYLILFVITFISVPISMMASTNRKPSNQQNHFEGASAPDQSLFNDNTEPSAPSESEFDEEYQGYPDLSKQNNDIDPVKASFLTAQEMEEFMTLSFEDQRALATCSIEEIKQVLNERLAQKAKQQKTAKNQSQFEGEEEAKRRSISTYNEEQLQQAMENSKRENYARKKTWFQLVTGWWSR